MILNFMLRDSKISTITIGYDHPKFWNPLSLTVSLCFNCAAIDSREEKNSCYNILIASLLLL